MNKHSGIHFFVGLCFFCQAGAGLIQIMPLGDSITWGLSSGQESPPIQGGYRAPLLIALQQAGQAVQFIGPINDNATPQQMQQNQANHAGFRGYRADELSASLDGKDPYQETAGFWITGASGQPALNPDIILLMAGTNDLLEGLGPQGAANNLEKLIIKIRTLCPNTSIVLAQLSPLYSAVAAQVPQYNANLQMLAIKYQKLGAQIEVVDNYTSLLPFGSHFKDNTHPDGITYHAMALNWFPKLMVSIWKRSMAHNAAA